MQQGVSHTDALAKAFGELADRLVNYAAESTQIDYRADAALFVSGVHAAGVGEEFQKRMRSFVRIERAIFRQIAQMRRAAQTVGGHVVAGDAGGSERRG